MSTFRLECPICPATLARMSPSSGFLPVPIRTSRRASSCGRTSSPQSFIGTMHEVTDRDPSANARIAIVCGQSAPMVLDIPAKPLRPRPAKGFRIPEILGRQGAVLYQRSGSTDQVVEQAALGERSGHRGDLLLFRLLWYAVNAQVLLEHRR